MSELITHTVTDWKMHKLEVDAKCHACDGSGVYDGMAEREGFGVQCSRCKGDGHYIHLFTFEEFEGKKKLEGVKRVVEHNPGIVLGGTDLEAFGGMPYEDWWNGKKFESGMENRTYTCPAWYYQKGTMWDECDPAGKPYSACLMFDDKALCWIKWDEEDSSSRP